MRIVVNTILLVYINCMYNCAFLNFILSKEKKNLLLKSYSNYHILEETTLECENSHCFNLHDNYPVR